MSKRQENFNMPAKPQVLYGFENETMEAKIRSFLKLSPPERIKTMIEFMEFAAAIERANPRNRAKKISRVVQSTKRRAH